MIRLLSNNRCRPSGQSGNAPPWMLTAVLLAALIVLGAFLLTTRFWLDEAPAVIGDWHAEVVYEDGGRFDERYVLRLTGSALSGSASYRGARRALEEGELGGDTVSFSVRTRERRGDEQVELRHVYTGTLEDGALRFVLETPGAAPITFVARRLPD